MPYEIQSVWISDEVEIMWGLIWIQLCKVIDNLLNYRCLSDTETVVRILVRLRKVLFKRNNISQEHAIPILDAGLHQHPVVFIRHLIG